MNRESLNNPPEKCTAHNRSGNRCGRYPVPGWTVCKLHGAHGGRPATNPKTILKNALRGNDLRMKADELIEDGYDVLDLTRVAAMLHIIADEVSCKRLDLEGGGLQMLLASLDLLRKTVDTIERIRASKAFTKAEEDYFVLRLVQFVETLPEAERPRALAYLQTMTLGAQIKEPFNSVEHVASLT